MRALSLLPVKILGTGIALPSNIVTTAAIKTRAFQDRAVDDLFSRTGIRTRRWADQDADHAAFARDALRAAARDAEIPLTAIGRIIFVNSTGGDALVPATVNCVIEGLGLDGVCDGFDLNNACMGFLSGLDVASRCVATGSRPVAVVAVELLSRHIDETNRRSFAVLGDAAAAAIVGPARGDAGIVSSWFGNRGSYRTSVTLAHTKAGEARETIQFAHSNRAITEEALGAISTSVEEVLRRAGLTRDEIAWYVIHQPNGSMFRKVLRAVKIPPEKTTPLVEELGSVGAASTAVGLHRVLRPGRARAGDHVLLAGVGSGMAYGALIYRVER